MAHTAVVPEVVEVSYPHPILHRGQSESTLHAGDAGTSTPVLMILMIIRVSGKDSDRLDYPLDQQKSYYNHGDLLPKNNIQFMLENGLFFVKRGTPVLFKRL